MQKNEELVALTKKMKASFCVVTCKALFNPNTGKTFADYTNHRVLVGKQSSIDKFKEVMADIKGSFEIKEQLEAIEVDERPDFKDLSPQEQKQIIDKLGELMISHDIDACISTSSEIVCNLKESEI